MAYSSPTEHTIQVQKLCDFCESDPKIKWRCVRCNVFMCNKCKNIHLKVQTSVQHEIVDIKTNISELHSKVVTDISCAKHGEKCCLFCRSCEILVCPDCIPSSHHSHRFEPIEDAISEYVEDLTKIQTDLSKCQTKTNEIKNVETTSDSFFEETISKIQLREENLQAIIHKYSKQLQDEIRAERKSVKESISQIKQKTEQTSEDLFAKRDNIWTLLTSNQGNIISGATKRVKYTSSLTLDPLPTETKQFSPGIDMTASLPELFGHLKTTTVPKGNADDTELKADKSRVVKIKPVDVDFDVSKMKEQLKDYIQQEVQNGVKLAMSELMQGMDNKTEQIKAAVIQDIKDQENNEFSSFSAFTSYGGLLSGDPIKYDKVLTNIGNDYAAGTGKFTARVTGLYCISFSMMGLHSNKGAYIFLMKNQDEFTRLYTAGSGIHEVASHTVFMNLSKNDTVWVKGCAGKKFYAAEPYNMFSGTLIRSGKF